VAGVAPAAQLAVPRAPRLTRPQLVAVAPRHGLAASPLARPAAAPFDVLL